MPVSGHSWSALSLLFIYVFCSNPLALDFKSWDCHKSQWWKWWGSYFPAQKWDGCAVLLMLCRKQPAVKSAKLRKSPRPAYNSWRDSNMLCDHRQVNRSVTYTYNPPSSQGNIRKTSSLPSWRHGCFCAPPMHKKRGHARAQSQADWPLAGHVLCRVCEKSRLSAPAEQANCTDD